VEKKMKVAGSKVGATGWVFEDFPLLLFEQQCAAGFIVKQKNSRAE
jgi:hypothetical protein